MAVMSVNSKGDTSMAFTMTLWKVHDGKLVELPKQRLDSEDRLEAWIEQEVSSWAWTC